MVRKTTGGTNKEITDIDGKYLPQGLYNSLHEGKLENLSKIYQDKAIKLKTEIDKLKFLQANYNDTTIKNELKNLEIRKFYEKTNFNEFLKADSFNNALGFIGEFITKYFAKYINFFSENGKAFFGIFFYAGNGAILKICILILIIVIAYAIINNGANMDNPFLVANDNNNIFITKPESTSFFSKILNNLKTFIPPEYRYQFANMSNSITYITTGKNNYDNKLIDRDIIESGRSDNIFHLNLTDNTTYQQEKTFCTIKPKDAIFKFNSNLYTTSDYNKIDKDILQDINYSKEYVVPIINDSNGRYFLNIDGAYYISDNNSNISNSNIPNLFKYTDNTKTNIIFNSIPNKSYSANIIDNNLIAYYGILTLVNVNYKGPIMKLYNTITRDIATIFITKSENTIYILKPDNTKVRFNDYYPNNAISNSNILVDTIYDQSGNQNHLIYNNINSRKRPILKLDENNRYYIDCNKDTNLNLSKSIKYPKLKIEIELYIDNINDIFIQTSEVNINDVTTEQRVNTNILFSTNNKNIKIIEKDLSTDNSKYIINVENMPTNNKNNIEYSLNSIQNINIYLDNYELNNLGSYNNNEGFIGRIYNLKIYNI